jgi:hypothetical protein
MTSSHEGEIVHRTLDTEADNPAAAVARTIAELERREVTDLESTWTCIDDMLDEVFSNPPSPEAQVEVTFSYEGYRITVEQNGHAKFARLGDGSR